MSDRFDDDGPQPSPTEGVRILGAEEAQAALDAGTVRPAAEPAPEAPRRAPVPPPVELAAAERDEADVADEPGVADVVDDDDDLPPRFPSDGPTWSASSTDEPPETPTSELEIPPLPHWREPPTGAVPAIFADDDEEADESDADLDAWASLSGSQPRFRAEGADWAEADFREGDLSGDRPRTGALSNEAPVDEDVAFAEAIEARRPRGTAAPEIGRAHV